MPEPLPRHPTGNKNRLSHNYAVLTFSCFAGAGATVAEPVAAYAVHTEPNIIVAARIPTNAFFINFFMKIIPPFFQNYLCEPHMGDTT